jgi:hypothetical protein
MFEFFEAIHHHNHALVVMPNSPTASPKYQAERESTGSLRTTAKSMQEALKVKKDPPTEISVEGDSFLGTSSSYDQGGGLD